MNSTNNTSRARGRGIAAAGLTMLTMGALAVAAQPASASSHRPCGVDKHSSTAGVEKVGGATATLGADGIKLTTTPNTNVDKVSWRTTFRLPQAASSVTELSYETVKLDRTANDNNVVNDAALPAYHIYVRTRQGDGVLIYEPYNYLSTIGAGNPQRQIRTEWNVLTGPLWTSSTTINGLPKSPGGPATLTFAEVVAANPGMTVTGIGWGLGTYNAGVIAIMDDQRFATTRTCTDHQWSTGFRSGVWWPGWLR